MTAPKTIAIPIDMLVKLTYIADLADGLTEDEVRAIRDAIELLGEHWPFARRTDPDDDITPPQPPATP